MESETVLTPDVSGISPSEGPPGTKLVIRGHNLGKDSKDFISVNVCGADCTKSTRWVSPGKIICTVDSLSFVQSVSGPVIVTTKSGGQGTCSLIFTLSFNRLKPLIVSSMWIDEECEGMIPGQMDTLEIDVKEIVCEPDPLGILRSNVYSSGVPINHESMAQHTSRIVDQSFHPIKFLIERHPKTKWDVLKKGYEELRKNLNVTSNTDIKSTSSFLSKNVGVVINVISDMYKLSRLLSEQRITSSDDLKSAIQKLSDDISANFDHLTVVYSSMLSHMAFLKMFDSHSHILRIPSQMVKCRKKKTNYITLIESLEQFLTTSTDQAPQLKQVFLAVETRVEDFIQCVIKDFSILYPLPLSTTLEFYKKIEFACKKIEYFVPILTSHKNWLKDVFEKCTQSFIDFLAAYGINKQIIETEKSLVDLYEKSTFQVVELCNVFQRELNFANSIIDFRRNQQRKLKKSAIRNEQSLIHLVLVDEIFNGYMKSFITCLRSLLLHPWILGRQKSYEPVSNCCTLTLVNINQTITLLDSITSVALSVKSSPVCLMTDTFHPQTGGKFEFTFYRNFFKKFNNLIFDMFLTLRNYYLDQISKTTSFTFSQEQSFKFYKDNFWAVPINFYSIICEWFMIFKTILSQVTRNQIIDIDLLQKFGQTYPQNFYFSIVKEQLEAFASSQHKKSLEAVIYYYDFLRSLNKSVLSKLESSNIFSVGWDGTNTDPLTFRDSIKNEFEAVDNFVKEALLLRACEIALAGVLKQLRKDYFAHQVAAPRHFYIPYLECLTNLRRQCLYYGDYMYSDIILALFKHFHTYLSKNIRLDGPAKLQQILYVNIHVIRHLGNLINPNIDLSGYDDILSKMETEELNRNASNKFDKLKIKWSSTLSVLSHN